MPTGDQMADFVAARIDAAIQQSALLRAQMQPEPPRRRSPDNRNLLENAVRHAESRVTVALAEHDGAGQLTLSIEDDGPGIAAEARERVFERFARLSDRLALIREENFEAVPAHRAYRRPTSPLIF